MLNVLSLRLCVLARGDAAGMWRTSPLELLMLNELSVALCSYSRCRCRCVAHIAYDLASAHGLPVHLPMLNSLTCTCQASLIAKQINTIKWRSPPLTTHTIYILH